MAKRKKAEEAVAAVVEPSEVAQTAVVEKIPKAKVAKKSPVGEKAAVDAKGRQLWRPGTNCGIIFDTFKKAKKGITVEALIAAVEIESKNKPYLVKKLVGEFIQRGFSAKKNDEGKIVFIP